MIRIAIVEDSREAREGFRYLLGLDREIKVIESFSSAEELFEKPDLIPHLDVVLMDIGLPGMNGIKATRHLKELSPRTDVLILTIFEDKDKILKAVQAGAAGYLLKNSDPSELAGQIKSLRRGGSPISPPVARALFDQLRQNTAEPEQQDYHLTPREKQILRSIVEGYTYKEIGEELCIASSTAKKHILHIYQKMKVRSKVEFVRKVLEENLLDEI